MTHFRFGSVVFGALFFFAGLAPAQASDFGRGSEFSYRSARLPNSLGCQILWASGTVVADAAGNSGGSGSSRAALPNPVPSPEIENPNLPLKWIPWTPEHDCDDFSWRFCRTYSRPDDCFSLVFGNRGVGGWGHAINIIRKKLANGNWQFCVVEPQYGGRTVECEGTKACWEQGPNSPTPEVPSDVQGTLWCAYKTSGLWKSWWRLEMCHCETDPCDEPHWEACGKPDVVRYYCEEYNRWGVDCPEFPACADVMGKPCKSGTGACTNDKQKQVPMSCTGGVWTVAPPLPTCAALSMETCSADGSRACLSGSGLNKILRCCKRTGKWCSDINPWP